MYAIATVAAVDDELSAPGINNFYPDITTNGQDYIGFTHAVYAPTLSDQPGNRKEKNWCICWLTDPSNTTGTNLFKIDESVSNTLWGDIPNGRQTQILNALALIGVDSSFITDTMTIVEIVLTVAQDLQPGYTGNPNGPSFS